MGVAMEVCSVKIDYFSLFFLETCMIALKILTSHRLGREKVWMNIWIVGHLRRGLNLF